MKVDKRLTLAVILALFIQTGGALIWAGAAAERLETLENEQAFRRAYLIRTVQIETELEAMQAQLARIEAKIDAL